MGRANNSPQTLTEILDQMFPQMLTIGMPSSEYWYGDVELAQGYLRAWKLKRQERNWEMWLQGRYIYDALIDVSPLFRFSTKRVKAEDYPSEPYALSKEEAEEREEAKAKAEMEKTQSWLFGWMNRVNNARKESSVNG